MDSDLKASSGLLAKLLEDPPHQCIAALRVSGCTCVTNVSLHVGISYCSFMNCENVYTFMISYVQHIELHRSCRTFLIAPVILAPCLEPQTRFAGTLRLDIRSPTHQTGHDTS